MDVIGLIIVWVGVIFCVLGVLGMIRFPDVYTRLHAGGLISTLGLVALSIGAAILMPSLTLKLLALGLFIIVTAPAATQAIAKAAYTVPEIDKEDYLPDQDVMPEAGD